MADHLDLILLILPITAMCACRGIESEAWCIAGHVENYNRTRVTVRACSPSTPSGKGPCRPLMDEQLHSLSRRLIELRMEHADLDVMIDQLSQQLPLDELTLRRLKKRRLLLRDQIVRLEQANEPDEPA
jgi:hypothetical protein